MSRSGKLLAINDKFIYELLSDPDYDVRPDGTVWSLIQRTGKRSINGSWRRIDRPRHDSHTTLHYCVKYKYKELQVHRVVFAKYKGELSPDLVVRHFDDIASNNHPDNLLIGTQSENNFDAVRNGKKAVYGNAKINFTVAEQIRKESSEGVPYSRLMVQYELSKGSISEIVNRHIWNDPNFDTK